MNQESPPGEHALALRDDFSPLRRHGAGTAHFTGQRPVPDNNIGWYRPPGRDRRCRLRRDREQADNAAAAAATT